MYFSPGIKNKLNDFFNFEALREELKDAIQDKNMPMIALYGLRRTGKTSLIRVVLNALKLKYVWLDGRDISSRENFNIKLKEEINRLKLIKLDKVAIKGVEIKFDSRNDLDFLNRKKVVLVIDEAQLLKRYGIDNKLAYIYDNFPHIKIIISGSEIGMLESFLGKNNARAPLYGRAVLEIKTYKLDTEYARRFLLEGAKQANRIISESELKVATESFGGIIGWLTKYGWYRLKVNHQIALEKTTEEGKVIAKEEFLKFAFRAESRYLAILQAVQTGARWEEIKKAVAISDSQLNAMLNRLKDHGFIEKIDHHYVIADPLLAAAL
jgi:AAA+ ATPase superfamily predicted ATPase